MSVNTVVEELPSQEPVVVEESTNTEVKSQDVAKDNVKEIPITEVVIDNDVMAVNILIAFTQIGHKRGAYNIEETSKLHEAIQYFTKKFNEPVPPSECA